MKYITPVYLIKYEKKINSHGDIVKDPAKTVERKVYSNKLSVGQKEFYEAHAKGMKPEMKFEVRDFEYLDEDTLKYNGVIYSVIRAFKNNKNGTYELTCSKPIMKVM